MKICETQGCAGNGRAVKTDKVDCIMCGKPMKDTRAALVDLLGKAGQRAEERQMEFLDMLDERLHKR